MSSMTENKNDKTFSRDMHGIRDIPEYVRRGMRMSSGQLRFCLTIATVLVFALIFVMILSSSWADHAVTVDEKAAVLQDAIGAERIEMGRKTIELHQEYGEKTVDGKRVILLQKVGQQSAGNAKVYWLTLCTEAEAAEYETGLGKDKVLILLDSRGDQGLYITLAKDSEVEKCKKTYPDSFFISLGKMKGEADLTGVPQAKQSLTAELLGELSFIHFGYNEDKAVRLTRGSTAEIEEIDNQKNSFRLLRVAVIFLLCAAAGALAFTLKSQKVLIKDASFQRSVRLCILAVAVLLLAALMVTTVRVNTLNDRLIRLGEITADADASGVQEGADVQTVREQNPDKYTYTSGSGKKEKAVTVSVPEMVKGLSAYRAVFYVSLALLVILAFALLYFFRYERDMGFPIFNAVLLIVLMFITLYPVLNTVAYSFNDGTDAARGGIGIWPRKFSIKSYERILNDPDIAQAGIISVSKTIITTVLNLFWTGMLSFALSRKEYVLRKFITLVMVLTMYVNAGLIPTYLLISQTLGLRNTFWVYIIPTMYSCFNMIIIRTYIMGLPNELVESARIDGAGDFRIYWQIIFPLCAPVLATVALFVAVGAWNSWFDTMLYIPTERRLDTLQYYLKGKLATAGQTSNLANSTVDAATASAAFSVTQRTVQCATTIVTALPILIVYPFLQKYFVTGMALGSVKG